MKRVLALLVTVAGCSAFALLGTGAASDDTEFPTYWIELDDAFGLVEGGDAKIAGVRAGTVSEMKIDERTHRALVEVELTETGFGSIRTDVTCQARPQSLIGEYFIDCLPGTDDTQLEPGSTIPVERTSSVVAPDLVNNILRRPYRERFRIIISELGAAVAGNAENLNAAIKRASPGLQETDKVLRILARQNRILADLVRDGDKVIGDLARNKEQVGRWVQMANRTSTASAERSADIAAGFNRLPGFLEELGPTMAELGNVADEQTPALRILADTAPRLETFFDRLGPFSEASRPAIRALGDAAETGSRAAKAAVPTAQELAEFAKDTPEVAKNLRIVLRHLDDRDHAAEEDAESPGGKGYTGLEALLQYVFDQVNSINIYDQSVHILKVAPFESACANYSDIQRALSEEHGHQLFEACGADVGPNAPGLNFPDTSRPDGIPPFGPLPEGAENPFPPGGSRAAKSVGDSLVRGTGTVAEPKPARNEPRPADAPPTLGDLIPGAPDVVIPDPPEAVDKATKLAQGDKTQSTLLDYLLGS